MIRSIILSYPILLILGCTSFNNQQPDGGESEFFFLNDVNTASFNQSNTCFSSNTKKIDSLTKLVPARLDKALTIDLYLTDEMFQLVSIQEFCTRLLNQTSREHLYNSCNWLKDLASLEDFSVSILKQCYYGDCQLDDEQFLRINKNITRIIKGGSPGGRFNGWKWQNGLYGLVNNAGELVQDFKYADIFSANEHIIMFRMDDKVSFFNEEGTWIHQTFYENFIFNSTMHNSYGPFSCIPKFFWYEIEDRFGLMNFKGDILTDPTCQNINGEIYNERFAIADGIIIDLDLMNIKQFPDYEFTDVYPDYNLAKAINIHSNVPSIININSDSIIANGYKSYEVLDSCLILASISEDMDCMSMTYDSLVLLNNKGEVLIESTAGINAIIIENEKLLVAREAVSMHGGGNVTDCHQFIVGGKWGMYDLKGNQIHKIKYTMNQLLLLINQERDFHWYFRND